MQRVRAETPRSGCSRSRFSALLAVVLYGLGTIVLPSLHLGLHRDDHDHRGGSIHRHSPRGLSVHPGHGHEHGHAGPPEAPLHDGAATASVSISAHADWQRRVAQKPQLVASLPSAPDSPVAPPNGDPVHTGGSLAHFAEVFFSPATQSFIPLVGPLIAPVDSPGYADLTLNAWSADPKKARAPPRAAALL